MKPQAKISQEVCRACFARYGKTWAERAVFYWQNGYVRCPLDAKEASRTQYSARDADIMLDEGPAYLLDKPPKHCPFMLEQVVSQEKP